MNSRPRGWPVPLPFDSAKSGKGTSPSDGKNVALAGPDGHQVEQLLRSSIRHGAATLGTIAKSAVERLLKSTNPQSVTQLFNPTETKQLADSLAATIATGTLLGRAGIRQRLAQAERYHEAVQKYGDAVEDFSEIPTDFTCFDDAPTPIAPLSPTEAIDYFLGLIPEWGDDPRRLEDTWERQAFTLAVDTEGIVLERVKEALAEILKTGQGAGRGTQIVQEILDQAGISPANPGYAETVYRTNTMDALVTGAMREMQDPDVADKFPVWKWLGIADGRQRPSHNVHFNRYFPNGVSFAEVRDSVKGSFDGFQCRCAPQAIYFKDWERLQSEGANVEAFAETAPVPTITQETNYSCGAAALRAVLAGYGIHKPEAFLRELLGTEPVNGTPPEAMVAGARKLGLDIEQQVGMTLAQLERHLLQGRPVIVALQAWGSPEGYASEESGHWSVAIGLNEHNILFADSELEGWLERGFIPKDEFMERWRDNDGKGNRFVRYGVVIKGARQGGARERFSERGMNMAEADLRLYAELCRLTRT